VNSVLERRFFAQVRRMPPRIPGRRNRRFKNTTSIPRDFISLFASLRRQLMMSSIIPALPSERFKNDFLPDEETM